MSRTGITIYVAATGAILRNEWHTPEALSTMMDALAPESADYLIGVHDPVTTRIDPVSRMPQPLLAYSLTVTTNQVSGIPAGSKVFVPSLGWQQVDDGVLDIDLELALPEDVVVEIINPIYAPDQKVSVPCE